MSSVLFKAFFSYSAYCSKDSYCWATTIALTVVTSPKGVAINDESILGSLRMFWFRVIGSLGLRSSAWPWAKTHRTPIVQAPVVCQCRHRVVLYFWLKMGFILKEIGEYFIVNLGLFRYRNTQFDFTVISESPQ